MAMKTNMLQKMLAGMSMVGLMSSASFAAAPGATQVEDSLAEMGCGGEKKDQKKDGDTSDGEGDKAGKKDKKEGGEHSCGKGSCG